MAVVRNKTQAIFLAAHYYRLNVEKNVDISDKGRNKPLIIENRNIKLKTDTKRRKFRFFLL